MRIKLWGVRGSVPTPLSGDMIENKIRRSLVLARPGDISSEEAIDAFINSLPFSLRRTIGGNTTSIEIETNLGDTLIIDCGSGIINLGHELMRREFGKGRGVAHIFLTHTHWDHIQGLPFFEPLFVRGNRINFYSPFKDIRQRLESQQNVSHFPIIMENMPSSKEFSRIEPEEEFFLNNSRITNKLMHHPGGAYGYRIENDGKVFVYTGDCEFNLDSIEKISAYRNFFERADVLVFDTQYTIKEAMDKYSWGHSSSSIAIDIAGKFNVKRLILFHHEPGYDDEKLDQVLLTAKSYLNMNAGRVGGLTVELGYEGMEFDL